MSTELLRKLRENAVQSATKPALHYRGQNLTYCQLYQKVDQLAQRLALPPGDRGLQTPVCLLGDDKLGLVIAQLAVLMAGRYFVVLDHHAAARVINSQIAHTGSNLTILINRPDSSSRWSVADFCNPTLTLQQLTTAQELVTEGLDEHSTRPVNRQNQPDLSDLPRNMAYVLFTSGSTGDAKAVMQTHEGLLDQMRRYAFDLGIQEDERVANIAPMSQDQAIDDTFAALLTPGASLHLYDMDGLNLQEARTFLQRQQVSLFTSVPKVFEQIFAGQNKEDFSNLRIVAIGSDVVTLEQVQVFQRHLPARCMLFNSYGATECSVISSFGIDQTKAREILNRGAKNVPIGVSYGQQNSRDTLELYIDSSGIAQDSNAPTVTIGELCVSGPGVSLGYLANQAATSQAFVEMAVNPGQRPKKWYRTGDLVLYDSESQEYRHLGRLAHLAKISGKRVNIQEVEAMLRQVLGLQECAVLAIETEFGSQLVAFVASAEQPLMGLEEAAEPRGLTALNGQTVFRQLQEQMQTHMIPRKFTVLERLPRLTNGKVDRMYLASFAKEQLPQTASANPSGDQQRTDEIINILRAKWRHCFGSAANNSIDHLDSLTRELFVQAFNKAVDMPLLHLPDLINYPTLAELSEFVRYFHDSLSRPHTAGALAIEYHDSSLPTINLNYNTLKALMDGYMKANLSLRLVPCVSLHDFIAKLREQKANKTPKVGYTVPACTFAGNTRDEVSREAHPTACFVECDPQGKLTVWISDSLGMEAGLYLPHVLFAITQSRDLYASPGGAALYVDSCRRQEEGDDRNCMVDALNFLLRAFAIPTFLSYLQGGASAVNCQFVDLPVEEIDITGLFASPKQIILANPRDNNARSLENLAERYTGVLQQHVQSELKQERYTVDEVRRFFLEVCLPELSMMKATRVEFASQAVRCILNSSGYQSIILQYINDNQQQWTELCRQVTDNGYAAPTMALAEICQRFSLPGKQDLLVSCNIIYDRSVASYRALEGHLSAIATTPRKP